VRSLSKVLDTKPEQGLDQVAGARSFKKKLDWEARVRSSSMVLATKWSKKVEQGTRSISWSKELEQGAGARSWSKELEQEA